MLLKNIKNLFFIKTRLFKLLLLLWAHNPWLFYPDNVPCHSWLVLHNFCAKNSTHIVPQPPYSPDLVQKANVGTPFWYDYKTNLGLTLLTTNWNCYLFCINVMFKF